MQRVSFSPIAVVGDVCGGVCVCVCSVCVCVCASACISIDVCRCVCVFGNKMIKRNCCIVESSNTRLVFICLLNKVVLIAERQSMKTRLWQLWGCSERKYVFDLNSISLNFLCNRRRHCRMQDRMFALTVAQRCRRCCCCCCTPGKQTRNR